MGDVQDGGPPEATGGILLSQKEYAQRRGWSKQYVNQLVKQGRIPLVGGKIDAAAADAAIAQSRDPARSSHSGATGYSRRSAEAPTGSVADGSTQGTFIKARTVRENYRALREKIEYEQLAEKVLAREEVEDAAYTIGSILRERLTASARRIGETVATTFGVNEAEAVALLEQEMHKALDDSARDLKAEIFDIRAGLIPGSAESG